VTRICFHKRFKRSKCLKGCFYLWITLIKKNYKGSHEMYNAHSYLGTDKIQTCKKYLCWANWVCFWLQLTSKWLFLDGNVIFQCKWLVFASIKQWRWPKVIPIYKNNCIYLIPWISPYAIDQIKCIIQAPNFSDNNWVSDYDGEWNMYIYDYILYIYCSIQGSKSKHTQFAQHRYFL
jgi:hypothetical protein